MLGFASKNSDNYKDAEGAFLKYIELNSNDANPYDSYAELLLKMGRFNESIQIYRRALSIEPEFAPSFIGIAANLVYQERHEEARSELNRYLEMAKSDDQRRLVYFNTAMTYVDEGKYELGIAALYEGYKLAEQSNDVSLMSTDLGNIGAILFAQGLYNGAFEKFDQSFQQISNSNLSPKRKEYAQRIYLYHEALIAMKRGDFDRAKAEADSFSLKVKEANDSGQMLASHELHGTIALEENRYKDAVAELVQASQQHADNLYRIALAYKNLGDYKKMRENAAKAANFNSLLNLHYALIRKKAMQLLLE
jgi:tetratricopeptide (TPR) repeat protein